MDSDLRFCIFWILIIECILYLQMNNNQFIIGDAKGSIHVNNISNARSVILAFPPHEDSSSEDNDSWSEEEQPVTNSISTIEVGEDGYLLTGDCVGQMRVSSKKIVKKFS